MFDCNLFFLCYNSTCISKEGKFCSMKTITISTENSETYSSISNFFIDYYMTDANGEFVKVYLYLARLLGSNSKITVAEIADHFNLTEKDICRAIKYWISKDVLKLNYNGRGQLNGIVLLPLHNPENELSGKETDIISFLRDDNDDESYMEQSANDKAEKKLSAKEMNSKSDSTVIQMPRTAEEVEFEAPPKTKFTAEDMSNLEGDEDWTDIVYQVETIFGKTVSSRDSQTLFYIYDTLGFDVDLFECLLEYCATMGKKNCRYMEAVAIAWYKDGIKTRQDAREQASLVSDVSRIIFKSLGIRSRVPSNIELAYISTWTKDFGFSRELIKNACDRAIINSPNSANFAYVNAILENWHNNNVKTLSDVERLDKEFNEKKRNNSVNSIQAKSTGGFNNFQQTKLDDELDEMEELFLKEVNKK